MKPERTFIAERAAALHCPELLRTGPSPEELAPRFHLAGGAFAKDFATTLAPLLGGKPPATTCAAASIDAIGDLAANTLFAVGPQAAPLLVSLDAGAVLAMVDRTFGGRGRAPDPLPESLPLSAELMLARLEALAAASLAAALGLASDTVRVLRRDGSLARLAPFAPGAPLLTLRVDMAEEGRDPWPVFLALEQTSLPVLFGPSGKSAAPRRHPRADPASEPFAALPLELAAVLVDMRMPMAALAGLEPGKVLPVAVERAVPLRLGTRTIARGSVGAADDRVAIRITQSFC